MLFIKKVWNNDDYNRIGFGRRSWIHGRGYRSGLRSGRYRVSLMDVESKALDSAIQTIGSSVNRLCTKGVVKEPLQDVMDRIAGVSDLSSVAEANWVIESVFEKEELKRDLFQELDRKAPPETLLATNTSSGPDLTDRRVIAPS